MAILTKHVILKWSNSAKAYYEALGYVFTGKGEEFTIAVEHLPPHSSAKVDVSCEGCGTVRRTRFERANQLCRSCANHVPERVEAASERMSLLWETRRDDMIEGKRRFWSTAEEQKRALVERMNHLRTIPEYREKWYHRGSEHHMWKDDLTDEHRRGERLIPGYAEWRKAVYERDNYTCVCCGQRGGSLQAHHLFNYATHESLRTSVDNGVTLCKACHRRFHVEYGTKHNTPEQFAEFKAEMSDTA
jgi:5-methylcytosine-specific restriction endonuclease McrA